MVTVTEVLKNVYVLKDRANCCANLVVGDNKALLFDTGSGVDDMNEVVRSMTKLPLLVINSHGHFDHIGGNNRFDKVYLSESDFPVLEDYDKEMLNRWMKELTREAAQPFLTAPNHLAKRPHRRLCGNMDTIGTVAFVRGCADAGYVPEFSKSSVKTGAV